MVDYGLENNGDAGNDEVDMQFDDDCNDEVELGAMTMMRLRFAAMVMVMMRLMCCAVC